MADGNSTNNSATAKNSWDYCGVFLTLDNELLPEERLSPTPSMKDGLDAETEQDLRILGCEFIQTAGILLKLPQVSHTFWVLLKLTLMGLGRSKQVCIVDLCQARMNEASYLIPSVIIMIL